MMMKLILAGCILLIPAITSAKTNGGCSVYIEYVRNSVVYTDSYSSPIHTLSLKSGDSIVATLSISGMCLDAVIINWSKEGQVVKTEEKELYGYPGLKFIYVIKGPGIYNAKIHGVANFTLTVTQELEPLALAQADLNPDLAIFPNPCNQRLQIQLEKSYRYVLKITDSKGRVVHEENFESDQIEVFTENFLPGIYIAEISNEFISRRKILIKL